MQSDTVLAARDERSNRATANAPSEDPLASLPVSRILEYPKGQVIYNQDQPPTGVYVIIDGKVKVCRETNGRTVVVDIYQTDEFFGESAFLSCPRRDEQAVALENTKVMMWTTEEIEGIVVYRPSLAVALVQTLARRLMDFGGRIYSCSKDDTQRRLVRTLIRLSERLGHTNEDGSIRIQPFTHELLSQCVGTSREAITRFMIDLRRGGYLDYSRRGEVVIRRDALMDWLKLEQVAKQPTVQKAAMAN
jgi:CRP/FNR family cyclic AMP-dependent transcriptional regulator